MLTKQQFMRELEDILEMDEGSLTENYRLMASEELDSISLLSIIALFDDKIGMILSLDSLKKIETVNDLLELANIGEHSSD